ncbi:MAG: hypothetical protein JO157_01980 [Acetobacteraceae bacterium]|nr:hypothetical protein [Acetobacteraceae bacterium]
MLTVEGLRFAEAPGVSYDVLLQNGRGRRAQIGHISFFNQTVPGNDAGRAATYMFEAGSALRVLGGTAAAIVFIPSSGVTGVGATVRPEARVRFDAVRIQQR